MQSRRALLAFSLASLILFSPTIWAWTMSQEQEEAMTLEPNLENGRKHYETCAICHTPLGWGTPDGRYPQIAGQHVNVIIKQLVDIRNGNRDNPTMIPFATNMFLHNNQDIADVAAYIAQLKMIPANHVGPGYDLAYGETLYKEHCAKCHGDNGEGSNEDYYPRLQGQHFEYMLRQMYWIQSRRRRNADETMVRQIHDFHGRDIHAVIDYASRLRPAPELLASEHSWQNPDFPTDFRTPPPPLNIQGMDPNFMPPPSWRPVPNPSIGFQFGSYPPPTNAYGNPTTTK